MMWTIRKVSSALAWKESHASLPREMRETTLPTFEVPRDEVWTFLGLEQSCSGDCKLVFLARKCDAEDAEVGGRLEFKE